MKCRSFLSGLEITLGKLCVKCYINKVRAALFLLAVNALVVCLIHLFLYIMSCDLRWWQGFMSTLSEEFTEDILNMQIPAQVAILVIFCDFLYFYKSWMNQDL